jgi:hypothetical protein
MLKPWLVFFAVAGAVVGIFAPLIGLSSRGGLNAWAGAVAAGLVFGFVAVLIARRGSSTSSSW